MKFNICLAFCVALSTGAFAQNIDISYQQHGDYMDVYDNTGHKLEINGHSNLSGSPMLNAEWGTGAVVFRNGKQVTGVPLRFNIKTNTLYFKNDTTTYAFADKVLAFRMEYYDGDDKKDVLFKSGYPNNRGDSSDLLYEAVNVGPNVHFLKLLRSNINQQYEYGTAAKETYTVHEDRYLYIVKRNKLVKITTSENAVLKALPEYKEQIEKFIAANNNKLDSDADINALITELNDVK